MKPKQSKKEFLKRLEADGRKLATTGVAEGVAAMLDFYADHRAEGCEIDEDGDMLLYQWGMHDSAKGETFQLDITRQFILPDEDEPFQLSLTFRFDPSPSLCRITSGNEWCGSPESLAELRAYISGSAAYLAVTNLKPKKVELKFGGC